MPCIEVSGLRKTYGSVVALDGIDLVVEEGRILGIVGPNGAGKSTALHALLGLVACEGSVRVLGRDPRHERHRLMREVSFIADVAVLPRWIRVGQLLDYVAGVHPRFDRAKAEGFVARGGMRSGGISQAGFRKGGKEQARKDCPAGNRTRRDGGTRRLAGSAARQHVGHGEQQDFQIERKRPVVNVFHVERHPPGEVELVPAFQDPQAGQTRFHAEPPPLPLFVLRHFLGQRGPGSDERHVPSQDIEQLGELVEAGSAQEPPERRDAGVAGTL